MFSLIRAPYTIEYTIHENPIVVFLKALIVWCYDFEAELVKIEEILDARRDWWWLRPSTDSKLEKRRSVPRESKTPQL